LCDRGEEGSGIRLTYAIYLRDALQANRFDPHYHQERFLALERALASSPYGIKSLKDIVDHLDYGLMPTEDYALDAQAGEPFIRVTNILPSGDIDLTDVKYIPFATASQSTKRVKTDDIIMVQCGNTTGKVAIVPKELNGSLYASFCFAIRAKSGTNQRYLFEVLGSRLVQEQIQRTWNVVSVRPSTSKPDVEALVIPHPLGPVQREMVAEMEKARESRRLKLKRADALLSGLDAFLLERLGLMPRREKYPYCFAARFRDLTNRCDPDFHSPKFKELRMSIEQSGYQVLSISDVCSAITTGFAAGREMQAFDETKGIPHIRPINISAKGELSFEGTKYVPRNSVSQSDVIQPNEVLFNNTNSTEWVGKSAVFESERLCCCSNHITRLVVNRSLVEPWYLTSFFNAIRSTGYLGLIATNFVNQAGINTETLSALRVPVPGLKIQLEIVDELNHRRKEARQLRNEAETEWEAAKTRFEARLLGEEVT